MMRNGWKHKRNKVWFGVFYNALNNIKVDLCRTILSIPYSAINAFLSQQAPSYILVIAELCIKSYSKVYSK